MKKLRLTLILLGGALAVFDSDNCAALTVTIMTSAWDTGVGYNVGTPPMLVPQQASGNSINFNAKLAGRSTDNSSASVMANSSFTGGTVILAGAALDFYPGADGNTPIQTAGGDASLYLIFQVDEDANYAFQCRCSGTVGAISDSVTFGPTEIVGNGSTTLSGTFAKGSLTTIHLDITAVSDALGPASGIVTFDLSLTPISVPHRFTPSQKASLTSASETDKRSAASLYAAAAAAFSALAPGLGGSLLSAALNETTEANVAADQAADPLDTNYTVLAQVVPAPLAPLALQSNITQLVADAFNSWMTNLSQSAGLSSALDTSINRAQGATAVSNAYWENAQMTAAVQFEAQLALVLDQEPLLRSNVVAQFQAAGLSIDVTTNDAQNLQMEIITNGLPTQLQDGLIQLGVDSAAITNIQFDLLAQNTSSIAGGFPQTLVDTNLDASQFAMSSSLRDASLTLINAALLPTGQLRFDVPTEPGYIYSIQFKQDLSNSANWTTVLTNHATSALLSFTNTPTSGQQAGFFRAIHN